MSGMTYELRDDLPLPVASTKGLYPFPEMKVGQSFAAPRAKRASLQAIASRNSRDGKRFETRLIGDEIFVWRVK